MHVRHKKWAKRNVVSSERVLYVDVRHVALFFLVGRGSLPMRMSHEKLYVLILNPINLWL